MRVDGDSTHAEHVKVLDALSSNLKAEVARGLRLLDSCVTQIAQAKWILTNVDDSLSGFSKGCPVCGILPEKEKPIKVSGGKGIHDKRVPGPASPKRNLEVTPPKPKPAINQLVRKRSPSPSPPPKPKPPPPVKPRIGPRSKTRPNEPVATSSAATGAGSVVLDTPAPSPKSEFKSITPVMGENKLPRKCKIVVSQTQPDVKLTDVRPYLLGRVTRVDLTNLGGFVSPTHAIPTELKFRPELIKVKSHKPAKLTVPGPASRRFLESLKKTPSKALTPATVNSSSSDDEKPLKSLKPKPVPPPRPPPKEKDSDSGSDYDYNFAAAAISSGSVKNKSKIGSQVTHNKRSRPLTTDSDEDYDIHRKSKGTKSIFKKKKTVSTSSDSDSDSDGYERRRKKKIKRKDSTDKEKEKHSSASKVHGHGSKSSSVASSRMTLTLNSGGGPSKEVKRSSSTTSKGNRERRDSSTSRGGGSTTGSLVKSESGKEVAGAGTTKPTTQAPTVPSVKIGYRPGPASRKPKPVETPASAGNNSPEYQRKAPEMSGEGEKKRGKVIQKEITTNGTKESPAKPDLFAALQQRVSKEAVGNPPPKKLDPLAMLRAKVKENTEAPPKDKPATKITMGGMSGLMDKFNPQMKAKLAARLAAIAAQNKGTVSGKTAKVPGPLRLPSSPASGSGGIQPAAEEAEKPDEVEEEKEIELGDDIIGKCIGDLGGDGEGSVHSPAPATENDHVPFTLSPMPPPTLQDCVSPTGVNKFFSPAPEPDSPSTVTVEKILKLLLKLADEPFADEPQLHSQDKLNELFEPGVSSCNDEVELSRADLMEGSWYLVKGKTLGRAVCADTISVFEFEKVASDELDRILAELESYTASSCR